METVKEEQRDRRLVDIKAFMRYCGLGQNMARELGKGIGARVQIGNRVLYDLKKTDAYFDKLTSEEATQ